MNYLDDYEEGVVTEKILLELILRLDSFKTVSKRYSVGALDLLGDLGGFYQFLDISIFMFAEFFAAKFFIQSIARELYKRKKTPDERKRDARWSKFKFDFKKKKRPEKVIKPDISEL